MEDTHDYQHTPTRSHNIQANIRQDTPPDIDFTDRHGYSPTVSPDTVRRYESAIFDLAGYGLEEEDYPVVDYESDLQTDMSTTVR
uniref:OSJNBa0032I19.8 protein n=2 Tax=Oryza sativa TaxID=4530 RepID=Q7XQ46_ORYSJ|nr:OSJNBa0032I19.8 [Oryza sativa Japonica Group]CAH66326.1 H0813E03.3 [Oryza sativa]